MFNDPAGFVMKHIFPRIVRSVEDETNTLVGLYNFDPRWFGRHLQMDRRIQHPIARGRYQRKPVPAGIR